MTSTLPYGKGAPTATILLVGDFYSSADEHSKTPFDGTAGTVLNKLLSDVGISRAQCYLTNAVNARPSGGTIEAWIPERKKDHTHAHQPLHDKLVSPIVLQGHKQLLEEISLLSPKLIITFGTLPLWMLTGLEPAAKWRGSNLVYNGIPLIPTHHPSTLLLQWDLRVAVLNDLRRALRQLTSPPPAPAWNFRIRPTFPQVQEILTLLHSRTLREPVWIDLDIETSRGHITCIGLSWSRTDALVIPLMTNSNREGYWSFFEESEIIYMLYRLLTAPNCRVRWQNGLYDAQYIYRHWHFIPRHGQDTMISWHTLFAGQKKSLDYQASILCDWYVNWKPEKVVWKTGG